MCEQEKSEERERQREKDRQRKRNARQNLTEEQKEKQREANRLRMQKKRKQETQLQTHKRRMSNREKMRKRRKTETSQQVKERRDRNKERMKEVRFAESQEEAKQRQKSNRHNMKKLRETESIGKKETRRRLNKENMRRIRRNESEEQKEMRRRRNKLSMTRIREHKSEEQKEMRRRWNKLAMTRIRENESEEQKRKRMTFNKESTTEIRRNETEEQKEERRRLNRQNMKRLREHEDDLVAVKRRRHNRQNMKEIRENESGKQKEERRKENRLRMTKIRGNKSKEQVEMRRRLNRVSTKEARRNETEKHTEERRRLNKQRMKTIRGTENKEQMETRRRYNRETTAEIRKNEREEEKEERRRHNRQNMRRVRESKNKLQQKKKRRLFGESTIGNSGSNTEEPVEKRVRHDKVLKNFSQKKNDWQKDKQKRKHHFLVQQVKEHETHNQTDQTKKITRDHTEEIRQRENEKQRKLQHKRERIQERRQAFNPLMRMMTKFVDRIRKRKERAFSGATTVKRHIKMRNALSRLSMYVRHREGKTKERKRLIKAANLALLQGARETFWNTVKEGPVYPCTCCHRLMYRNSVTSVTDHMKLRQTASGNVALSEAYLHYCGDEKLWLCHTCKQGIQRSKLPCQSVANHLLLEQTPPELDGLNELEKRIISLRIPFMKMVALPRGKQKSIHGPAVNVPAKLNTVCNLLPRLPSELELIPLKLKRRLIYKGHYMYQDIRPSKVITALKWLKQHNCHYKDVNINDNWEKQVADEELWEAITSSNSVTEVQQTSFSADDSLIVHGTMSHLKQLALSAGYNVIDVPGDGNCLFHAVSLQLQPPLNHSTLRQNVVTYLREHPFTHSGDHYSAFVTLNSHPENTPLDDNQRWERYLQGMAQDSWGDAVVLQGLADMLNTNIKVISTDNANTPLITPQAAEIQVQERSTINLGLISESHYTALQVLPDDHQVSESPEMSKTQSKGAKIGSEEAEADSASNEMEKEDEAAFEERRKTAGLAHASCLQQDLDWDESVFAIAPAEGERPLSFFNDTFFEEMANPDKYPTGRMGFSQQRQVPLSMRRFYNQRLLNADGRFAKDVDYLFTAQYATECKQIHSDVGICLRQTKGTLQAGQNVTAGTVKNTAKLQEIIRKDQAYKFLKNVRGSPAYWQKTLYDLLAMIRQLGIPTWFFTLSAADLVWPDMIQSIALQYGCFFTENEVQAMTWEEKSHWIRQNPVTTARHFQYRLDNIMNKFIQSEAAPLGVVTDHFHVIEFQARGSPHTHGLLWVKDAPVLHEDSEDDICSFIDRYITCSRQESNKCFQTLVERFQTHHHSSSCRKYKNTPCRFSYPRPPSTKTLISRIPDGEDSVDYDPVLKAVRIEIEKNETNGQTLLQILKKVNVTEELYEEALKTSKEGCTVVMKRELDEMWTNSYNLELLRTWKANIDVQFVLDPYACIMYIVSYMIKGENCIGDLLQAAAKEASAPDIKAQMKKVASTFLNSREVSAQEAVYRQLSMPLKKSSRQVVFINTNPKEKRVAMLKRQDIIDNMSDEDDNIFQTSLLDRYQARPQALEEITLAEFTANYKTLYLKNDGHNQDQMNAGNRFYLQNGLGTMTKRKREAVIRYHRPNITKQPEEFYRTALMMYFPWREETEIIGQYDSYLEAYQDRYDTLREVEARYSKHGPIVDHACNVLGKQGPPEHAWAQIAPTAEQERHEDEAEGYEELRGIDAADLAANADIIEKDETRQSPIEAIAAKFTAESVEERMTRDSYLQSMRGLNTQQYTILHHHRQWLKNFVSSLKEGKKQPPPYQLFLSGPGGVGKSHVIHLIHYETIRLFRLAGVCRPQDVPALLLAPTGTAAFNIGGMTIHSALLLSPNNARRFVPPSADRLNTLRERLSSLKLIIIDEISMVGSDLLHMIHKSMSYIMGSKELFGNVSVLAVGDLFQLQPVRQRHVFLPTTDSTAQFANHWRSYFSFFQLTKVMRQKDIEFAELLNRMRTGDLTETDINTLTSREIKYHPNYPTDIMHVFTTNHKVDCHNEDKLKTLEGPIYSLECTDYRKDRHTQHLTVTPSIKHTETGGLRKYLQLAIGARVMLTSNVDVSDGLVNGAIGTVAGFIFQQEDVSTVLILFDNKRVGRTAKQQSPYICQYPEAVPIARIEVVFCVGTRQSVQMSRKQFPLTLAWACTIHKVQGMTMKSILVSMSGRFMPGQAYVACSRVTSLNGLFIEDFTPSKIRANPMVQEETQRLQTCQIETALHHQCLSSPSIISISCLNIRSYRKYQEELCRSKVLADIMCFQETKLTAVMEDQLNFPPGYSHHNQAVSGNKHGLLCCVSPKLKGKVLHLYTELKWKYKHFLSAN